MIALLLASLIAFQSPAARDAVALKSWLVAGPIDATGPALATEVKSLCDDLLAQDGFDAKRLDPEPGETFLGLGPHLGEPASVAWAAQESIHLGSGPTPRFALAFAQIRVDRYTECKLVLHSMHRCRIYLDGAQVAEKNKAEPKEATKPAEITADLSLETGPHRLVVRSVFDPTGIDDWNLEASLEAKPDFAAAAIETNWLPRRPIVVEDFLDAATIASLDVNPRGDLVAVSMRRPEVPADFSKHWIEIRDARDLHLVFTSESLGDFSEFQWLPDGSGFSYVVRDGDKGTLWRRDANGGAARPILRDVEKLGSVRWLPGGRGILYVVTTEEKADDRGVKRMRGLVDRWPGQRNVGHLWFANCDGVGLRSKIVGGDLSVALVDVRADGKAVLFQRTRYDVLERPYQSTDLFELDLTTLEATKIYSSGSLAGAAYSGRNDEIFVLGGPSNLAVGAAARGTTIPNDFDTLLYSLDRGSKSVEPIVRDLSANVKNLIPAVKSGGMFLLLEDGLTVGAARLDLATRTLSRLKLPFDVATTLAASEDGRRIAVAGTGLSNPQRLVTLDPIQADAGGPVWAPEDQRFSRIAFGETERYDLKLASGETIEGYVHLPLGYDKTKRYPAIVFYYGGTMPVPRDFGGRYPRDLWAANGYVTYTLTPSGATGRGTEFAARHVNDWGDRTCTEILACLDRFLADHPAVDPARVGCIGASYGGFMTESLLTKTNKFKAAVSHAGISALSSYWGEGFWGYQYSAVATAEKFPWNAREIYIDKSPLFHADKITASLLLSHGDSDTNVPIGESEQMYTALKLLGKDVEFLKWSGQDHHVLTYPIRKLWMKSILAWFDWKLKDQPGAWKKLFPK